MLHRLNRLLCGAVTLALADPLQAAEGGGDAPPSLFGSPGDLVIAICTLVIFLLVFVVLSKFAWRPLLNALQKREKFIRDNLESARRDQETASAKLAEYEERIAKSKEEAAAIVEEGRRDATELGRRLQAQAKGEADAMIERARREINIARDTALRDLHEQSAQLAINIAGTVLKRQLTPEDHQRLIAEALSDLNQRPPGQN